MRSEKVLSYVDNLPASLTIDVPEDTVLTLNIAAFEKLQNSKIVVKVHRDADFEGYMADFSVFQGKVEVLVELLEEGAECNWRLSSMGMKDAKKEFITSVIHSAPHTTATMSNYGITKDESRLIFKGTGTIEKGAVKTNTKQVAKIIVFDPKSDGVASPALVIDDNDVSASHAAVVGRLNEEHLYYLQSRGVSLEEAKRLIAAGYLKPIEAGFADENVKNRIDSIIEGGFVGFDVRSKGSAILATLDSALDAVLGNSGAIHHIIEGTEDGLAIKIKDVVEDALGVGVTGSDESVIDLGKLVVVNLFFVSEGEDFSVLWELSFDLVAAGESKR